jgi:hypothetical protein
MLRKQPKEPGKGRGRCVPSCQNKIDNNVSKKDVLRVSGSLLLRLYLPSSISPLAEAAASSSRRVSITPIANLSTSATASQSSLASPMSSAALTFYINKGYERTTFAVWKVARSKASANLTRGRETSKQAGSTPNPSCKYCQGKTWQRRREGQKLGQSWKPHGEREGDDQSFLW